MILFPDEGCFGQKIDFNDPAVLFVPSKTGAAIRLQARGNDSTDSESQITLGNV